MKPVAKVVLWLIAFFLLLLAVTVAIVKSTGGRMIW
jgi:hypothetical protein